MSKLLGRKNRATRIAEWLHTQRGPMACELRLEVSNSEGELEKLTSWDRSDLKAFDPDSVAQEADRTLQNHAEEMESRVSGRLALYTKDGAMWAILTVKAEPADGPASNHDGSTKNVLVMLQRHYETAGMAYFKAAEQALRIQDQTSQTMIQVMEVLKQLVVMREDRGMRLEQDIAQLRDQNSELRSVASDAEQLAEQSTELAEEAAKQVEELKKKGSEDAEIFGMVKKAFSEGIVPKPGGSKPVKRQEG